VVAFATAAVTNATKVG